MRVGLNATCLNDRPSGAKQRFQCLYGSLFKLLPDVEFIVFDPSDCRVSDWFTNQPNVFRRETPIPSLGRAGKFMKGLHYWKSAFASEEFDIFEALHLPLIRQPHGKTILTIHDMRGLNRENSITKRVLFAAVLKDALKRADHVITVSNTMRSEILEFYPNATVSVVYNGINTSSVEKVTEHEVKQFRAKYGVPREYVLAVGHLERRKNYPRLIEAIAHLRHRGFDCPLVIIGNDSGEASSINNLISILGLQNQVTFLAGLTDDEVLCAYRCCSLFVFPSLYEGFGIPILEAMVAGKPSVLSDIPIFREITENQGIYFDQQNVEHIASSIEVGLTNFELRQRMIGYGYRRAADFDYKEVSCELARLYQFLGN
jgi:glycosyltransferase involved in cell wall biosynthesis